MFLLGGYLWFPCCFPCDLLICSFLVLGKTVIPKSANEVKLISSGKILENDKTVGQCSIPFGEVAGGVLVMHVVVQPSLAKMKTGIIYVQFLHIPWLLTVDLMLV